MSRRKRKICVVIWIFCLQASSVCAFEIELAQIPWLFQEDGQGVYDQVITEAIERAGVDGQLSYLPPMRARLKFEGAQSGCLSPANKAEYADNNEVIASVPFNLAKVLVLTKKGKPVINDSADLEQKSVGVVHGLRLDVLERIPGIKLDKVRKNLQLLKMLSFERIDVIVDYAPDILLTIRETSQYLAKAEYDPNYSLLSAENSVVCFRTPETEVFLHGLNLAIESMKNDGTLREILGDAYLFDQ